MSSLSHADMALFNTFVKSTQYIVGLSSHQDLWEHAGKLLITHFQAGWVAFVRQEPGGRLSVEHCVPAGGPTCQQLTTAQIQGIVHDVLESGFLAHEVIAAPAPSMTVFLPLAGEHQAGKMLLIGHSTPDPLPRERLDIYLALAGLAGTMLERLHVEQELNLHQTDLERLVRARTAELATAKRQNELILDSISEGIFGVDASGRIVFVNPAAGQMTGWEPAELVGRQAHATFHHSHCDGSGYPAAECALHDTLRTGRTCHVRDDRFFRKDRTAFPVEFMTTPIIEDGRTIGAVLVFRDITERHSAEESLRASRERLDLAMISSRMATFDWDIVHDKRTWSEGVHKLLGTNPDTFTGRPEEFFQAIHPDDRSGVQASLARAIATGDYEAEYRAVWADGSIHYIAARGRVHRDEAGRAVQLTGVCWDITARKQTELQLKELNETLEKRVAERTAVAEVRAEQLRMLAQELTQAEQKERQRIAHVLHEHFQQLLVGAKFNLSMVQAKDADSQESLRRTDQVLAEAVEASRSLAVELNPPILRYGGLAPALGWLGQWMHEKHSLNVEVEAEAHLPVLPEDVQVFLFQSVRELLFNVVKHAKVDRARIDLRQEPGHLLRLSVSDKGAGFRTDPFVAKTCASGGFGLFSIRERIGFLNGRVDVQSPPAAGTCISLLLPLSETVQATVRAASSGPLEREVDGREHSVADLKVPAARIRVLIADDHAVVRDGLAGLLQRQPDVEVVGLAADGQEAIDLANQLRPDVIIMDINMPQVDGIEATRQIKARHPQVHVVGLSMFNEEEAARSMKTVGAACYLPKTSGPNVLMSAIRHCMAKVPPAI